MLPVIALENAPFLGKQEKFWEGKDARCAILIGRYFRENDVWNGNCKMEGNVSGDIC